MAKCCQDRIDQQNKYKFGISSNEPWLDKSTGILLVKMKIIIFILANLGIMFIYSLFSKNDDETIIAGTCGL
jgi:hypothetical protein